MAQKSAEARRLKAVKPALRQPAVVAPVPLDPYLAARLARVRAQLDRIDEMMMNEVEPPMLDKLAAASARLAEQERLLAHRPLPGSERPKEKRPASTLTGKILD
jgi:hypothetical protein